MSLTTTSSQIQTNNSLLGHAASLTRQSARP